MTIQKKGENNKNKWKGLWRATYFMDKKEIRYCRCKFEVLCWQRYRTKQYGDCVFKKISDLFN